MVCQGAGTRWVEAQGCRFGSNTDSLAASGWVRLLSRKPPPLPQLANALSAYHSHSGYSLIYSSTTTL